MDCLGPQLALWMVSTSLTSQWKVAIVNAIVEGNTLHDNAFEGQAVNLDTEFLKMSWSFPPMMSSTVIAKIKS